MNEIRPLYARVREDLITRISAAEWAPGEVIPSENALAAEMGVSQGTVRKAIDQLCANGALRRVQGKGTFVAEQTPELANFRFFRLVDYNGNRVVPEMLRQEPTQRAATPEQARALGIDAGAPVHQIERLRTINGERAILETVAVARDVMPGLSEDRKLPNALYPHYQAAYGISVLRTRESLSAIHADAAQSRRLQVAPRGALLRVERVAFDLLGRSVEHRVSLFVTRAHRFSVELQ